MALLDDPMKLRDAMAYDDAFCTTALGLDWALFFGFTIFSTVQSSSSSSSSSSLTSIMEDLEEGSIIAPLSSILPFGLASKCSLPMESSTNVT